MNQNLEGIIENSAQNLVSPPQDKTNVTSNVSKKIPDSINYKTHVAYADFIKAADFRSKIQSLFIFGKYFLIVAIKRVISYELIPADLRNPKTLSDFIVTLKKIALNIGYKFLPRQNKPVSKAGEQISASLDKQGICVVDINSYQFDKIDALALPLLEKLRQTRAQRKGGSREFIESRSTALRSASKDLFNAVEAALTASGILPGIARYLGHPVSIVDINPQINDSSDDFWQRFFPDLAIEKPATAYCHRDASGGDVKVILYLSDVEPENGPFSFILGSHRNRPGRFANMVQEINDTSGFSSTDPKARRLFSALPALLQKKCAFGNDLQTESEVAQQLLAAEWKITASKGHAVIFDSKGIHRGGMVLEKERIVLTCVVG